MKRIIMLIIVSTIFFLVGCSSSKEDDLSKKVDKLGEEVQVLKDENKELKDKEEKEKEENENEDSNALKDESPKEEDNDTEEEAAEPSEEVSRVNINQVYYTNDSDVDSLKKQVEDNGKNVQLKTGLEGNTLLILETNNEIKDVRHYSLGDEFFELEFDIEKYLAKYKDDNYSALTYTLTSDDVLIVKVNEAEGIPTDCITWIDNDGKLNYHLVEYNGKG